MPIRATVKSLAIFLIALAMLSAPAVDSAFAQSKKKNPVVALVNGKKIHLSDVQALHRAMPARIRAIPLQRIYKPLLEQAIAVALLSTEGRKAKLQDSETVKNQLARVEERLIQEAYLAMLIAKSVNDEAIKKRYETFKTEYKGAEEVRASHILVKDKKAALAIIRKLEKGEDFAKLAKDNSIGPSKARGGDLGWFQKSQMVKSFAQAAFGLKKGQHTKEPVKTRFGWHVIKLSDRRTKPAPPFEKVKGQLRDDLAQKVAQAEVKRLRASAKIERFNADGSPVKAKDGKPADKKPAK